MLAKPALLAGALLSALILLIAAAAAGVVSILTGGLLDPDDAGRPQPTGDYGQVICRVDGGIHGQGLNLDPAQAGNAAVINQVALDDGVQPPGRAVVIALAAAIQESGLENLDHGDRDSLGLFQQRPSQGWGTAAQIMNPAYAANRFYAHLQAIPDWWSIPLWQAAQAVQGSAYPAAYQHWQPEALTLQQFLTADPKACQPIRTGK
jgi:hypothetical protein